MGKISEIMLLKQPKQPALAVEVQTDMNGMSEAIGKNFVNDYWSKVIQRITG